MEKGFYINNRRRLYDSLVNGTVLLMFAGRAPRKTGDEYYPFFANRNFVYLTGLVREHFILMAVKENDAVSEKIFILPKDLLKERWTGTRMSPEEVSESSGIEATGYVDDVKTELDRLLKTGKFNTVAMDLYKEAPDDINAPESFEWVTYIKENYPGLALKDVMPQLRKQRTIKQPCEIEAMRKSAVITRAGIMAMMKASRPGMYEYQYKAEFDYALAQRGCLAPGFPSIVSAGNNNFCIHYYDYKGKSKDGDMILNDVSACYDNVMNDVSRGWPANGKFSEKQKALYQCAYNTSQHMFSIIKPGMQMQDVDRLAREYNYEQLKAIGLCETYDDISKYMWHGGAHHVGFDVHDQVFIEGPIKPGMVFCVDIGIYVEKWGIGFRLEDNCLVTEDGCENLTVSIPRTIDEIEGYMSQFDHTPLD